MKIYTKTGDHGTTALFGGTRVSKDDLRIEAYGTVDEANACIAIVRDQDVNKKRESVLIAIQEHLFTIGSLLAVAPGKTGVHVPRLNREDVALLERAIDEMDAVLPPLRNFILPGGHIAVSHCHVARTVCRRAERNIIALHQREPVDLLIIQYMNRLSDYLFVVARMMAHELGVPETPWKPAT